MENKQDRNAFNTQKEADERVKNEQERADSQVKSGDLHEAQADAEAKPEQSGAASTKEGRKALAEVDPQFAGKGTKERLEEITADEEVSAEDQDKVVDADQEIRAALTQKDQGIPDIPNAEGDDKKVVEGVEKAQADKADKADEAK